MDLVVDVAQIADDQLPHLFERHWQGRNKRGGLGLGLYICKQLVEAHGGAIDVETRAEQGSMFSFTVPARRAAPGVQPA